jgi:hypothetical protein
MIEDSTNFYEIEEKFLIVLDSAIPTQIGNLQTNILQALANKSDLYFDLETPVQKSLEDIQLKCSVKSAVFPNSQYLINSYNSYFAICLIDDTNTPIDGGNKVIEIEKGNYNTESLRIELSTQINTEFNNNGFADVSFLVSYDSSKYTYIFVMNTANTSIRQFYISFQPKDLGTNISVSQLGTVLGFNNDFIYCSGNAIEPLNTNTFFSGINKQVFAPYPSNLSGLRSINVILKNYSTSSIPIRPYNSLIGFKNSIVNSNFNSSIKTTFIRQNVICNIICNANPMEYIFYEKQNDFYIDFKEPYLGRIHILLTDNYGNLLELNNQDWTLTLEMSLLKKKEFKTRSFYEYLSRS